MFFNPKSAENLTAMFNVSGRNAGSGEDDLFQAAFKYVGVHESAIAFGYRDEHFCFIGNETFLKNNLHVQRINKAILEKIIIDNFW